MSAPVLAKSYDRPASLDLPRSPRGRSTVISPLRVQVLDEGGV